MTDEPMRPDPDRLLEQTAEAHRGKLKIFFGACAGVGKTFAMLMEAQRLRAQGLDILIGVVETHGRKETAALLTGLATQPPQRISHRGRLVTEFDLDAALARRPALILMDELAHSNAPGSRHPKRWQDVEELLEAGIDVFTTVNVQHLESLNDVVSGVTGIQVRETVPIRFLILPMKSYWLTCRRTICASACMKAKCILPARPNAPSNIFSAKET